jgi:hypothetical protein
MLADLQRDTEFGRQREQRVAAGQRVHATGVRDDANALRLQLRQRLAHRDLHEVHRVAGTGVLRALRGQDRHRDLGEVVEHQVVDLAMVQQLRHGQCGVAPESRGAADAYRAAPFRRVGIHLHSTSPAGSAAAWHCAQCRMRHTQGNRQRRPGLRPENMATQRRKGHR